MRFFIGEDYKQPRAFGIFEKNGVYTVYKNKANGERAIRYSGKDEAYAVNELYQKMHSEVMMRKAKLAKGGDSSGCSAKSKRSSLLSGILSIVPIIFLVLIIIFSTRFCNKGPSRGYYDYNGDTYYFQHDTWYGYNPVGGWTAVTPNGELSDNYDDYYKGKSYDGSSNYSDFGKSDYCHDDSYWNSDDDDDNWNSNDDWDSGDTDWGSDW